MLAKWLITYGAVRDAVTCQPAILSTQGYDNCLTYILIPRTGLLQSLKFPILWFRVVVKKFLNYGQTALDKIYKQLKKKTTWRFKALPKDILISLAKGES